VRIYSYVVDHDEGRRPDPYFKVCTLCGCKCRSSREKPRNVEELAEKGDWVIATGGASKRSAGRGKLIYAMRVDEKLTREKYYKDPRFAKKKPERPVVDFEKREQFALVSRHFYYFGAEAKDIRGFKVEKNCRGFHYVDPADFRPFLEWLEKEYKLGKHGEPCGKVVDESRGKTRCRSSC
jgi:hypothetical protein